MLQDCLPCSRVLDRVASPRLQWPVVALLACIVVPSTGWSQEGCFSAPVAGEAGHTRHALVVGVGRYASASVDRLPGPANDAQRIYGLLTGPNGYEFPAANVCKLVDEGATVAAFRAALRELARRATAGDVAVIFVASHGSQLADLDGDEPDGLDETLLLHDSRTPEVGDLVDDEIQELLAAVQRKTPNVTAIFDSCNSGSVQRGDALARFQPPSGIAPVPAPPRTPPDRAVDIVAGELPGLVVFSAASDGTSALEVDGKGIFTDALLTVLSPVSKQPLTYAQVARQVPHLVAARSYQIPYFNGDLDKVVFGSSSRTRPVALEVKSITPVIALVGPPIPGLGAGAEMRVYDGAASGSETGDPGRAKATLVVNTSDGVNTTARVVSRPPDAAAVKEGDLAVLVRPADAFLKLRVRLRPADQPQGLSAEVAAGIRWAVQENEESRMSVETTAEPADLELSAGAPGGVDLRESAGVLLASFAGDAMAKLVADALWQLARQRAVLQLRGEGGTEFVDGETLRVEMVPADQQTECAAGPWIPAGGGSDQIVPLCHRWRVRVTLAASSPRPLLIGGLALSSDGSMFGFPKDGVQVKLDPGKSFEFISKFEGGLPLERPEHLLVFGTQETNPVPWYLLTATARDRGPDAGGSLYRALHRYFQPGARGTSVVFEEVEDTTWTMSSMRYRVRAPAAFGSRVLDKDKTCDPAASCGRPPVSRLEAGKASDELGHCVALDGETLYAGAPGDDERGRRAGAVHVFRRAGGRWSRLQTLRAGETGEEDAFGTAVAADAETLLVGSPFADSPGHSAASAVVIIEPGIAPWSRQAPVERAGAVYVFQRDHDEWTEAARLVADPPVAGTRFGDVVALEGHVAVIAASAWGRSPPAPGAVWIFERTGAAWKPAARLHGTPPVASAAFGSAVAIRGDVVAVGAPGTGEGTGAVHLFERGADGWLEVSRLVDPDPEQGERFGASLAFVDDLLLVGGPHDGEAPSLPGLVRVFRKQGQAWDLVATLRASTEHDGFGRALAGLGPAIVVGGWGKAHLFSRRGDSWSRTALLAGEENRYSFGRAVALTDSAVLVGGGVDGDRHGAVFAFELPATDGLHAGAP